MVKWRKNKPKVVLLQCSQTMPPCGLTVARPVHRAMATQRATSAWRMCCSRSQAARCCCSFWQTQGWRTLLLIPLQMSRFCCLMLLRWKTALTSTMQVLIHPL